MNYDWSLHRAINIAATAHSGQFRKGGSRDVPYISHPFAVYGLVRSFTQESDVLIAALLHDVLEDCNEFAAMLGNFSLRVQEIVTALTDPKPMDAYYQDRKRFFIGQVIRGGNDAVLISGCDKIHNMASVIESLRQHESTGTRPLPESVWYWERFYEEAGGHLPDRCAQLFRETLTEVKLFLPPVQ